MTSTHRPDFRRRPGWALLLAGFTLVLVVPGYLFYRHDAQRVRLGAYNQLAAIGEMKADQIANWRQKRLDDAGKTARSPFFMRGVEAWLKEPDNATLRDDPIQRLRLEPRTGDIADALLIDREGRVLLTTQDGPGPLDAAAMKAVALTWESKQASLSELFRGSDGNVYLDVVAPVAAADTSLSPSWSCGVTLRHFSTRSSRPGLSRAGAPRPSSSVGSVTTFSSSTNSATGPALP